MPTTRVRPRARPTARELGTYPSSSITLRTRAAVDSSSSPLPLSTRDTVVLLTFARAATSAMVIGTGPPGALQRCNQMVEPQCRNRFRERFRAVNSSEPRHVNARPALFRFRDSNSGLASLGWLAPYNRRDGAPLATAAHPAAATTGTPSHRRRSRGARGALASTRRTSSGSTAPSRASTIKPAYGSPRVAPWLTIATRMPSLAARSTNRRPDMTVREEPSTKLHVAVRVDRGHRGREPRVGGVKPFDQLLPSGGRAAVQAGDPGQVAVQLHHAVRTAGLVQTVHVLGDDAVHHGQLLQPGDRTMPRVRASPADGAPAQMAAGPVAPPRDRVPGERLVRHRRVPPRRPGRPAVVRDPRLGRQAGPAEHHHTPVGDPFGQPSDQLVTFHRTMVPRRPRRPRTGIQRSAYSGADR